MAPRGRPAAARNAINPAVLEGMLAVRATLLEVCDHFEVSEESVRRFVKRHYRVNFETLARRFASKTKVSVRRFYLATAMSQKPNGEPKYPGLLKDAAVRFGDLPTPVMVTRNPEQHEDEIAVQREAIANAPTPVSAEDARVTALLGILTTITKR